MIAFPDIDPIALQIGPVSVHWYGLMYGVGFIGAWFLAQISMKRPHIHWDSEQFSDLFLYVILGVVVGGRLGYMLFYTTGNSTLQIWEVWKGGMSFHGGLLGVIFAMWLYAYRNQRGFFDVADFIAPLVPFGIFTVRIGNFINSELWGKVADASIPWAVVFPNGGPLPRHPSQLYEALLEGLLMLIILWLFSIRPRPRMAISALFLIIYGASRFTVEFVRVPDAQLGYLYGGWFTMGMLLTTPMILGGVGLLWWAYYRQPHSDAASHS